MSCIALIRPFWFPVLDYVEGDFSNSLLLSLLIRENKLKVSLLGTQITKANFFLITKFQVLTIKFSEDLSNLGC